MSRYWQKNRNIDQWKRKRGRGESDISVHNYNYMIFFFTKLQNIYIGKIYSIFKKWWWQTTYTESFVPHLEENSTPNES